VGAVGGLATALCLLPHGRRHGVRVARRQLCRFLGFSVPRRDRPKRPRAPVELGSHCAVARGAVKPFDSARTLHEAFRRFAKSVPANAAELGDHGSVFGRHAARVKRRLKTHPDVKGLTMRLPGDGCAGPGSIPGADHQREWPHRLVDPALTVGSVDWPRVRRPARSAATHASGGTAPYHRQAGGRQRRCHAWGRLCTSPASGRTSSGPTFTSGRLPLARRCLLSADRLPAQPDDCGGGHASIEPIFGVEQSAALRAAPLQPASA